MIALAIIATLLWFAAAGEFENSSVWLAGFVAIWVTALHFAN